ncbi:MAG: hypothetical protein AAGF12_09595 [Myxococcota bacterium]
MTPARHYTYVGPESIRSACEGEPPGHAISDIEQLHAWLDELCRLDPSAEGWATYVVGIDGQLRVAHRRTEHVACAGGGDVLGAGEVQFDDTGEVLWISNYSSGYCPDVSCYEEVRSAFERANLPLPSSFSHAVVFRKCPACGARNVIKDEDFHCAICTAPVPREWNFAKQTGTR